MRIEVLGPLDLATLPVSLDEIARMRVEVWEGFGAVPRAAIDGRWSDEGDPAALHWVVLGDGALVGSARLTLIATPAHAVLRSAGYPMPAAMIERLVLRPSARGRGLSRELDTRRLEAARQRGYATVGAETHSSRVPSLEALGFRCVRAMTDAEVPVSPPPPGLPFSPSTPEVGDRSWLLAVRVADTRAT